MSIFIIFNSFLCMLQYWKMVTQLEIPELLHWKIATSFLFSFIVSFLSFSHLSLSSLVYWAKAGVTGITSHSSNSLKALYFLLVTSPTPILSCCLNRQATPSLKAHLIKSLTFKKSSLSSHSKSMVLAK